MQAAELEVEKEKKESSSRTLWPALLGVFFIVRGVLSYSKDPDGGGIIRIVLGAILRIAVVAMVAVQKKDK